MAQPRPATRRVFFALWPQAAVARALADAARVAQAVCGGRAMRADTLHLTLAFIGAVEEARLAELEAAAAQVRAGACELAFDRLGYWRHNRIVWAGVSAPPPALVDLAAQLHAQLRAAGVRIEQRPFAAHVTLLRKAACTAPPAPLAAPVLWQAAEFVLVESQLTAAGASYTVLRRWPLAVR